MGNSFKLRGYAVERMLGRGASGEVWRGRVLATGAAVALKRIATIDDEQRRRAEAEAALLCALEHPNLVRLHAVEPAADALVLVLDLAEGGSLADLLAARGRLTVGEVITAVSPVAAAVAYLHGQGVVHGDISAANVLFTAKGVPLLADVGVARLRGDESAAAATPAYVDPAVAAGGVPGPASDVFMLGGLALHALTGRPTWLGADSPTALDQARHADLAEVRARLGALEPPEVAAVLNRALDSDPQRRGAAADFALELRHAARPVAVELGAGRLRPAPPAAWSGPRHAAAAPSRPGQGAAPADAARPAFARPHDGAPGAEPPTRAVGPRPRPVIPRPARRRRLHPAALGIGLGVVGSAIVAGGLVLARADGPDAHRRATTHPAASAISLAPSSSPAQTSTSSARGSVRAAPDRSSAASAKHPPRQVETGSPAPVRPTPPATAFWLSALKRIDDLRARAFATRNPTLLRDVYSAPALASADVAQLRRLVPPGCLLPGVRSTYRDVTVHPSGDRASVQVAATLPPTELHCHGKVRATLPGAGPTRLELVLLRTRAGVRIAEQRLG